MRCRLEWKHVRNRFTMAEEGGSRVTLGSVARTQVWVVASFTEVRKTKRRTVLEIWAESRCSTLAYIGVNVVFLNHENESGERMRHFEGRPRIAH